MMIYLHVLTLLSIIVSSTAKPDGAPESACHSLRPDHGGITPQETASPYIVTAVRSGQDRITVTISPPAGYHEFFEGFMLQARSASDRNRFIPGVFETSSDMMHYAKAIKCNGIDKSTLTHVNPDPKMLISTVWQASHHVKEDIIFRATVAHKFDKFWMNIDSEPVKMKADKHKSYEEIIYGGCSISKGCKGLPNHCEEDRSCQVLFTYRDNMDGTIRFALHGKLESSEYMAMALSDDDRMGNDSVTECYQTKANDVKLRRSWNEGKSNTRTSDEHGPYDYKIEDGYTTCGWSEPNITSHFGRTYYLLDEEYFLLLAKGPIVNGRLRIHSSKERFGQPISFFYHERETDPMHESPEPDDESDEEIEEMVTTSSEGMVTTQTEEMDSTPTETMENDGRSCSSLLNSHLSLLALFIAFHAGIKLFMV